MGDIGSNNPWIFGWTQLLTIIGFLITITIAIGGFRTFGRWRREQLEAKRIDVAIEALTVAYRTKFVFENIRSAFSSGSEWADMPQLPGDDENKRARRGSFYAVFKRIERNKEFFEDVWKLQPKFMAIFGPETEATFKKLHQARRNIEVAAQMLFDKALEPDGRDDEASTRELYSELRGHLWAGMSRVNKKKDEVADLLAAFQNDIEAICLPLLKEFRKTVPR